MVRAEPRSAAALALVAAAVIATTFSAAMMGALPAGAAARQPMRLQPRCAVPTRLSKGQIVVPVVVDFGGSAAKLLVTCVVTRAGTTGAELLQAQARLVGYPIPRYAESGLLCGIDGYPTSGCGTESGGHYSYWAYWHGGARWLYANDGPGEWTVSKGDVEGWRFEPDGSASPADPPPRAPSSAAALETASQAGVTSSAGVEASSRDASGPVRQSGDSNSAARKALFASCVALILLLAAAALVRARRANGHIT